MVATSRKQPTCSFQILGSTDCLLFSHVICSDDPWQTASVNRTVILDYCALLSSLQTAPSLPYFMVECDGCGHCRDLQTPSPGLVGPLDCLRADILFAGPS